MNKPIDPDASPEEFDRDLRRALAEMVEKGILVVIPSPDGNPDNDLFVMPEFLPKHKEEIN